MGWKVRRVDLKDTLTLCIGYVVPPLPLPLPTKLLGFLQPPLFQLH